MRVDLTPTLVTVPWPDSKAMASPTSNGLSRPMLIDANRSPSTFCSASATATPPTPRLATNAVMLMPPSANNASTSVTHTTNCTAQVSTPSITGLTGCAASPSADRCSHATSSVETQNATWMPTSAYVSKRSQCCAF